MPGLHATPAALTAHAGASPFPLASLDQVSLAAAAPCVSPTILNGALQETSYAREQTSVSVSTPGDAGTLLAGQCSSGGTLVQSKKNSPEKLAMLLKSLQVRLTSILPDKSDEAAKPARPGVPAPKPSLN